MLCEICKKREATFFMKEVIFGETKTHALCEICAKKHKETLMPSSLTIEKLIKNLMDFTENENEKEKRIDEKSLTKKQRDKRCKTCGSTYDEVILGFAPGCPDCYKTFSKDIDELIKVHAKDITYNGTKPLSFKYMSNEFDDSNEEYIDEENLNEQDYKIKKINDEIKNSLKENSKLNINDEDINKKIKTTNKKNKTNKIEKEIEKENKIIKLKRELNDALKIEDYDMAAKLRDEIRMLENNDTKNITKEKNIKTKSKLNSKSKTNKEKGKE